jgi:16S rRNA (uracil1498-N3)-methyltransferase
VFLGSLQEGENILTGGDALHLARVLRAREGMNVTAFDGAGLEAAGVVAAVAPERVVLQLAAPEPSQVEAALSVTVAVALLKGDKLKDVVRQGTELGAVSFIPLRLARCDSRELSVNRLERLRRVAREAAKQSGRSVVPDVTGMQTLQQLLAERDGSAAAGSAPALLFADPRASQTLGDVLADVPVTRELLIVTGPEGGLTPAECELLEAHGARGVRLGNRILRAETAPVALLAALLLPEAL